MDDMERSQMDKNTFKRIHKKKEILWNCSWISGMIIALFAAEFYVWNNAASDSLLILMIFTPFIAVGLTLALVKPIDKFLRRTALKEYWVEDHGDVIKLFGSVGLADIHYVYRDVLSVKPGFKIVDDAHKKYGCTVAAIKATKSELEAKAKLGGMGIPVHSIG